MAFIVTARKYRPQKFADVIGQEHITTTLKNAISSGRIAHAYLFTGPRGVGKTTSARILAKAINCSNLKDGEPCDECEMCLSIQNTQLMDIIEIDAASNRGIDEIRTLRESVKYAPTKGKNKVYIIDEVHMLTKDSFNAFLKTLEEPPSHTVFIFATTDVHRVPSTIISRCQRYDFRRIPVQSIKNLLKEIASKEEIEIDDKALTMIAKKSFGGLRDAESFFDQAAAFCGNKIDYQTVVKIFNMIDESIYFKISDSILSKNFSSAFEITTKIFESGWDFQDFTDGLIEHFRNIITVVVTGKSDLIDSAEDFKTLYMNYKDEFNESDILRILAYLNKFYQELKFSQNHRLRTEVALLHLIGLEKSDTISNLLKQVSSLSPLTDSSVAQPKKALSSKPPVIATQAEAKFEQSPNKISSSSQISKMNSPSQIEERRNVTNDYKPLSVSENIFSFSQITDKWSSFIETFSEDRGMLFGPLLNQIKPIGLNQNEVKITIKDEFGRVIFEKHNDYFAQKGLEFFGKKLSFNCVDCDEDEEEEIEQSISEIDENKTSLQNSTEIKIRNNEEENDPFVKLVKNELSGEEIQ